MSPHTFFDINCRGSFNIFQAAAERAEKIGRFIHISSTAAYSVDVQGPVIKEETPLTPVKLYGATKVAIEALLRTFRFRFNVPAVVLRPNVIMACEEILEGWRLAWVDGVLRVADKRYTCYVPDAREPWKLVEDAVRDEKQRVIPYGPGRRPWTWHITDVRDVVHAVELALDKDEAIGETFCIAGPKPARWDEVVKHLCQRLGENYAEVDLPNLWHFEFDLSKSRKMLGYNPQYTPERMIDDGIAFRKGEDIGVIPPAIPH